MDIENKRIQEVIKFLIFHRKIKNPTDFAAQLKFHSGNLTKILGGERGVSSDLKWKIYDTFHINKPYIFDGTGELDFEPAQETILENNELDKLRETNKSLNRTIKAMQKTIDAQGITINAQGITIKELQKELGEKQHPEPVQETKFAKNTEQIRSKAFKSR